MSDAMERVQRHIAEGCNDRCGLVPDDRWWCPSSERMVLCPGPCPDGSVHERRDGTVFMHHLGDEFRGGPA